MFAVQSANFKGGSPVLQFELYTSIPGFLILDVRLLFPSSFTILFLLGGCGGRGRDDLGGPESMLSLAGGGGGAKERLEPPGAGGKGLLEVGVFRPGGAGGLGLEGVDLGTREDKNTEAKYKDFILGG